MSEVTDIEIGVDCIEISRFIERKDGLIKKIFTEEEIKYCENRGKPVQHYAVRFAGKEALIKAMYSFGVSLDVTQVEILNDKSGKPHARIMQEIQDLYNIKISLSHSDNMAIAMVVVTKNNG